MIEKKQLSQEELSEVVGGSQFTHDLESLTFNHGVGDRVSYWDSNGEYGAVVKKQGYISLWQSYYSYLYLEFDDNKKPTGWYSDEADRKIIGPVLDQYLCYLTVVAE